MKGVAYLRSLPAIRERCSVIYEAAKAGTLSHFTLDLSKLDEVVEYVKQTMDINYPGNAADIPFHSSRFRHFEAGGIDRVEQLAAAEGAGGRRRRCRRLIDLAVTSVLLDAGAGDAWKYTEAAAAAAAEGGEGFVGGRSEGLGVASFHMFRAGAFSSDPEGHPHRADAEGLQALTPAKVAEAFQVDAAANPLVGCAGRAGLLRRLGAALAGRPRYFARGGLCRPGHLYDFLLAERVRDNKLDTHDLWEVVMYGFEALWPEEGRLVVAGTNMGDVAAQRLPPAPGGGRGGGGGWPAYTPFFSLSIWMTYSLMEPLQKTAGWSIENLGAMTGLPEYRNGGLLVDMGVLVPKAEETLAKAHAPDAEVIIEWRALTVALLDEIALALRSKLNVSEEDFPLVKILEGGTWKAGRRIAAERRPDTRGPPIAIDSDGTVF
ncbi:unnamed protein product [Heterosigma akashiwo]